MTFRTLLAAAALALAALPATARDDAYPVTFAHAFGETTLEAKPERIVTIGWMSHDAVIALGETPIGIPLQTWGGDAHGLLPWNTEALEARGDSLPETFDTGANGSELPFEEILGLAPDVILAPYSGFEESDYQRLAAIAPTVAYPQAPWSGTWQEVTRTVGRALGKPDAGEQVIADTLATMDAYAAAHPEFEGKTFTFGYAYPDGSGIGVYVATDPRVQMVEDLGLTLAPGAAALPTDQGFYADVSLERLETVDADILITWHDSEADREALRANPVFARFRPVAEGRHIGLVDRSFAMALSAPSPLGIPWAMDRFVPLLAEALQ